MIETLHFYIFVKNIIHQFCKDVHNHFLIIGIAAGIAIGWLSATAKSGKAAGNLRAEISEKETDIKMLRREMELTGEQRRKDDEARDRHYAEQLRVTREQLKMPQTSCSTYARKSLTAPIPPR